MPLHGEDVLVIVFDGLDDAVGGKGHRSKSWREAEAAWLVQTVRQEVWSAHLEIQEAYEAFPATEVLVRDAAESTRSTRERYEVGADTITDLLDTQTALARAEGALVEAQWDRHAARASFDGAVGKLQIQAHQTS